MSWNDTQIQKRDFVVVSYLYYVLCATGLMFPVLMVFDRSLEMWLFSFQLYDFSAIRLSVLGDTLLRMVS